MSTKKKTGADVEPTAEAKRDERAAQWLKRHAAEIKRADESGFGIPARLKWPTDDHTLIGTTFAVDGLPYGGIYVFGRPSHNAELELVQIGRLIAHPSL